MTVQSAQVTLQDFWSGERWTLAGAATAMLAMPIIYSVLVPFLLLDVWVQLYQAAAFRLLRISPVRRQRYFVLDRRRLGYLNPLQKAHCVYCGYVNGLIAFVREVAARTEQFWCPIRHRTSIPGQHRRHRRFAPYGDAAAFHRVLPVLRRQLARDAPRRPTRRR